MDDVFGRNIFSKYFEAFFCKLKVEKYFFEDRQNLKLSSRRRFEIEGSPRSRSGVQELYVALSTP